MILYCCGFKLNLLRRRVDAFSVIFLIRSAYCINPNLMLMFAVGGLQVEGRYSRGMYPVSSLAAYCNAALIQMDRAKRDILPRKR